MLHDIGYYGCDPNAWKKLVNSGDNIETEANRRPHQNRGVFLAGNILERVSHSEQCGNEIADIIGDHDTRKLPTTNNGEIVRAADLLWRVTYPCTQLYHSDISTEKALEKMEKQGICMSAPYNLGKIETQIGRIELVNSIFFKFQSKSQELLGLKYKQELERIFEFYGN